MLAKPSLNWTDLLTSAAAEAYRATDNLMAMVKDEDLDWKPTGGKNWMTTGQLLMHLTTACGFCYQGFVTGDWGLPEGVSFEDIPKDEMMPPAEKMPAVSSVAEARRLLAADRELGARMLADAGEERLQAEMSRAPWAGPDCPENSLGEHLMGMVNHLTSHKSQLFFYLKLRGLDVNTSHLWGM